MRDYFNEAQVMRAFNSGTVRGKVFPCPGSSQNKSDIPDTGAVCKPYWESLPGFNTQLRAAVIPSLLPGEVRRGGLNLPLFDAVSTGRGFHHSIFLSRLVMSSLSSWVSTHTCVWMEPGKGEQGQGEGKRSPLKLNALFSGREILKHCGWHCPPAKQQQRGCQDKRTSSQQATK